MPGILIVARVTPSAAEKPKTAQYGPLALLGEGQNNPKRDSSSHPVFPAPYRIAIEKALDHASRHKRRAIGHMRNHISIMAD